MKSACRKNYQIFRHTIFRRILRACLFCLVGGALLPPREATLSKLTMMGLTLVCGIAASAHRELLRPVAEIRQPTFNRAALAAQYRHGRASPRVSTGSSRSLQDRQYLYWRLDQPWCYQYNCRSERYSGCHLGDGSRGHPRAATD